MKPKTFIYIGLGILSLLGTVAFAGIRRTSIPLSPVLNGRHSHVQELAVPVITQSTTTSCGEAAITMAYGYAYPPDAISERAVIEYAESQGLYMPDLAPFTSPADMGWTRTALRRCSRDWQRIQWAGRPQPADRQIQSW